MNKNKIIAGLTSIAAVFVFAITAHAATTYTLFGDATIVPTGNPGNAAQLESNEPGGFAGVDFESDTVTTLNDLTNLATDYNFTENSCGAGSPRFQVNLEDPNSADTGNMFVYIGTPPNYTDCPMNVWTSTGNLVAPASLVDTTQLDGGMPYDPYADALVKYGDYLVTGVQLVADGEWMFSGDQVVLVDNVEINSDVVTFDEPEPVGSPTSKDECKNGGWEDFGFSNQGQCIRFVNTGQDSR